MEANGNAVYHLLTITSNTHWKTKGFLKEFFGFFSCCFKAMKVTMLIVRTLLFCLQLC